MKEAWPWIRRLLVMVVFVGIWWLHRRQPDYRAAEAYACAGLVSCTAWLALTGRL